MKAFTVNQTLQARSACDQDCIFSGIVISRTAKTIKVDVKNFGIKTLRIFLDSFEGNECVRPLGSYSMAPVFEA